MVVPAIFFKNSFRSVVTILAAGPAVAQLLPNVVGRLVKLTVTLPDPTEVLMVYTA